jgi:zinc and cadmium transporter
MSLFYALIAALIVSVISLVGAISLTLSDKILKKILISLVSFSAGSLMGGAFFHLIPESLQDYHGSLRPFFYLLIGFCLFFILERVLRWHHCHKPECETHQFLGQLNIVGGTVHNFVDGLVIMSGFALNPVLGISVTIAIIFHEIPQEIGDFGVLIYAGFSKLKAILYNFISAAAAILGVLFGYFLLDQVSGINQFLLPFAAGGFIYIAASDLVPELHQEQNTVRALISFIIFILALGLMSLLRLFGG